METVTSVYFDGKKSVLGNYVDINDRKRSEEILKASAEAKKFNRDLSAKMDKEYVGKLKEKGMTVTELTAKQIVPFQEKMTPVWDMFADKIGKDLIQKIKDTK